MTVAGVKKLEESILVNIFKAKMILFQVDCI